MLKKFRGLLYGLSIVAVVLVNFVAQPVKAAALDDLKDLLSDSRISTAANHTITIDMATGDTWAAGETLIIDFDDAFNSTGFANNEPEDFDIVVGATEESIVANGGCATNDAIEITTVNTTTDTFTFTACGSYTTESGNGHEIVIEIGTNATSGGSGNDQLVNPGTIGSKLVNISGTFNGSVAKDTLVAITEGVTLTATVDETLTFTIAGVSSANCDTTGGTEIANTSSTAVNYDSIGTLSPDTFYDGCQLLTAGTNASGGYSATVQTTSLPTSGSNTIAKGNCNGACSDTNSNPWSASTSNGYGYCMKDEVGDAATTVDAEWGTNNCGAGTQHFRTIANVGGAQPAQAIMSSAGATTNNDESEIGFRLSFDSGQAAGTYTWTVVYICTPTF